MRDAIVTRRSAIAARGSTPSAIHNHAFLRHASAATRHFFFALGSEVWGLNGVVLMDIHRCQCTLNIRGFFLSDKFFNFCLFGDLNNYAVQQKKECVNIKRTTTTTTPFGLIITVIHILVSQDVSIAN